MVKQKTGRGQIELYSDGAMIGRPSSRTPSEFGLRLSALREERGLTQTAFADILGMSQQQVCYYERRARSPSIEVVQRIATALKLPVDALLPNGEAQPKGRTGRPSDFEQRWERLKALPRPTQRDIIEMIDVAIERAERRQA